MNTNTNPTKTHKLSHLVSDIDEPAPKAKTLTENHDAPSDPWAESARVSIAAQAPLRAVPERAGDPTVEMIREFDRNRENATDALNVRVSSETTIALNRYMAKCNPLDSRRRKVGRAGLVEFAVRDFLSRNSV